MRVEGAGSGGRFQKVPEVPGCAGVGSGGRFRKVPEGSGGFRRVLVSVPGSRGFRCVLVSVPDATSGRFRKVPESVVCYLATLTGAAM